MINCSKRSEDEIRQTSYTTVCEIWATVLTIASKDTMPIRYGVAEVFALLDGVAVVTTVILYIFMVCYIHEKSGSCWLSSGDVNYKCIHS